MAGVDLERRLGPRAARSRETRRRIIDAALRLFVEEGYMPTTMSAIAKEAGVAVQNRFIGEQEDEKRRVNARFDEERSRLKQIWSPQNGGGK